MTTFLDLANQALQVAGTRTNMTLTEFNDQTSNESIQINLILAQLANELARMAPWDCCMKFAPLTYLTSLPTTPENNAAGPPMWQPGLPAPPWAYEYAYPYDCNRMIKIIPQYTALAGSVPIYAPGTVTGAAGVGWTGPPLKFKVATDRFYSITGLTMTSGGTDYDTDDVIVFPQPTATFVQQYTPLQASIPSLTYTMPVGAPASVVVTEINGTGTITAFELINAVGYYGFSPGAPNNGYNGSSPAATLTLASGSYFQLMATGTELTQSYTFSGASVNGAPQNTGAIGFGTGATFTIASWVATTQRVILCNQENAIACYLASPGDPNTWDFLYQDAFIHLLGARLAMQLSGDKGLANQLIALTNNMIMEARKNDGNEGLTINDVTPDFLRVRGNYGGPNWEMSPNMSFDWGSFYSPY